jgi:hypothetical protein
MLGDNEKIQGVDLAEVFSRMVEEIPWATLKAYVQANAQLLKMCTAGGHRLEPKRRNRVEKILVREAEKAEYSQTFCNGVFAAWYPVHEELHKTLEDYFHSDEYKAYREEHDLEEDDYVLSDEKFDEFFSIDALQEWRVLLCFSPLKFTQEQAGKILDDSQGNTELLERISELEEKLEDQEKKRGQLEAEAERLREREQQSTSEAQDIKKANRKLRADTDALENKLEAALAEGKRLREQVEEAEAGQKRFEAKLREQMKRDSARMRNELSRVEKELANWQSKYEEQRLANRRLEEGIEEAQTQAADAKANEEEANAEIQRLRKFADLILSRIDWPKVGGQMKLTPALRRQFNSLIKRLTYEDDRTLTIEGVLTDFWESLMTKERQLIDSIARSNSLEVMTGDVENYWMALTDAFGDVEISLEARIVLLKTLQEIFYQVLEMDDLEVPKIPPKKTGRARRNTALV